MNNQPIQLSFSIFWSYYSSNLEWDILQAARLVLKLNQELSKFDVRFVTLKGVVKIVLSRLNKGLIVKKITIGRKKTLRGDYFNERTPLRDCTMIQISI